MKVEFTDKDIQNLLSFLDRVEVKGLTEVAVMNRLVSMLAPPQQTGGEEKSKSK